MPAYTNSFRSPKYIEETINDGNGNVVGTIRIKPSSVQWKPSGAHKYYSVSLSAFAKWITSEEAGARKASR